VLAPVASSSALSAVASARRVVSVASAPVVAWAVSSGVGLETSEVEAQPIVVAQSTSRSRVVFFIRKTSRDGTGSPAGYRS